MPTQYSCRNERRRVLVRDTAGATGLPLVNGIDYLEVTSADETVLTVHFLHGLPGSGRPDATPAGPPLTAENVVVAGGVRTTGIKVVSVAAAAELLTVTVDRAGDFSPYVLRLRRSALVEDPPAGFDPQLSQVSFSFKAGCSSDFDCAPTDACPPERLDEPEIDYLAKDYSSFRRLMLDRMAAIMPDWQERHAADVGVALVEILAYAADQLSYYQDAVATEAYLGTARSRVSVRRHARLLDHSMHDGCNARAWVQVRVAAAAVQLPRGTQLLTRLPGVPPVLAPASAAYDRALRLAPVVFETMADVTLRSACNDIALHTWGDENCCLPRGATRATLRDTGHALKDLAAGAVLIFEETRGPDTGVTADANPAHRCAVRLTAAPRFAIDPILFEDAAHTQPQRVADVEWGPDDALPFPLCLAEVEDPDDPARTKQPVSLAHGNVVLADHGQTTVQALPAVPAAGRYRPALANRPLTQQGTVPGAVAGRRPVLFDPGAAASAAMAWDPHSARPAIFLVQDGEAGNPWLPQADLLESDRFARDFVAETEDDGTAKLRFGDGILGAIPGGQLVATYRAGNGRAGDVGAETIFHVVTGAGGIDRARNLLAGQGGADPEPLTAVRQYAPAAFRVQERAVTVEDYAEVSQRHPGVQKAAATLRWTGSWYTVFDSVDRSRGLPVDAAFKADMLGFLEPFRLAGFDLDVDAPRYVPLDIAMSVCVVPGYFRADVEQALLLVFSNRDLPDGRRGFFHPDNFIFAQPVYLSQVVAAAMAVPGVSWVDMEASPAKPNRFQRWGQLPRGELQAGEIDMGRLEIARLDNDPSLPENGRIQFLMEDGQ